MLERHQLLVYLNEILEPEKFDDYGPNGLQVEGKKQIKKIMTGVSACQALIDRAVSEKVDALLVHHGLFWEGDDRRIVGICKKRLKALLEHDINLIAYHLPLDAHPLYGNNAQLANILGIELNQKISNDLLFAGAFRDFIEASAFADLLETKLKRKPLFIEGGTHRIKTVAWCSGGGQKFIDKAIALNVDAYFTGEVSEKTVHIARENHIHFYSAGHHATERYGIKTLGELLAQKFNIVHEFVDIDNPV